MTGKFDLVTRAGHIPHSERARVLAEMPELELQKHMKRLFQSMLPNAIVEILQGAEEYGKDLVVVEDGPFGKRVSAFVVKRGRIVGKSGGIIDTIKSQVTQAWKHRVRIPGSTGVLRVTEVYVVISGTVSKGAQTRIEIEVTDENKVNGIWAIDQLVKAFTSHYPAVFFDTELVSFLQQQISRLERDPMLTAVAPGKSLTDCFVEPLVMRFGDNISQVPTVREALRNMTQLNFQELRQLIARSPRTLVVGGPGSGKTTALNKLALDMTAAAFEEALRSGEEHVQVPIRIDALRITEIADAQHLIAATLGGEHASDRYSVSVLMIDGLDEVRPESRQSVIDKSVTLSQGLKCRLMLTSRPVEALADAFPGFTRVELMRFQYSQAIKLFDRMVPEQTLRTTLEEGLDRVKWQIEMTPLTLILLIESVKSHKEVPASVSELYERFFDHALGREDTRRGISVLFDYQIKGQFLQDLAFDEFFCKDRIVVPRIDFDRFLEIQALKFGWDS